MREIWVTLAILVFCAWNARGLLDAWWHSPFEVLTWLVFLIWLIPLVLHRLQKPFVYQPFFLASALFLTILGNVGELNTFTYIAFAIALFSLIPFSWTSLIWLLGAVAWMPLFGWFAAYYFPLLTVPLRLLISIAAIFPIALYRNLSKN